LLFAGWNERRKSLGNSGGEIYRDLSKNLIFIRPIYRTLFSRNRAYAAFDQKTIGKIINKLNPKGVVFDPMSGYGGLSDFCRQREQEISTCCIELNPPSYLWQILCDTSRKEQFKEVINAVKHACQKTKINSKITLQTTNSWFPSESERILKNIWEFSMDKISSSLSGEIAEDALGAVILPFLGRLCAFTNSSINIQVKEGGVVFFNDWKEDLLLYLSFIEDKFISKYNTPCSQHEVVFGDITKNCSMRQKYSYMLTSPPYPNMRDYYAFFFPENYALEKIFGIERFISAAVRKNMIGTSAISGIKKDIAVDPTMLISKSALKFLADLSAWKGHKKSMNDNISYYVPYYFYYFQMLQKAFAEIGKNLEPYVDAYIIVVNNTARKFVIPVKSFVLETWAYMGYTAEEDEEFTNEKAHVGSINPKVVGFKARHMEYAIRIRKGF
jgi:hypothetical protein